MALYKGQDFFSEGTCVFGASEETLWAPLDTDLLSEADHIFYVGKGKSNPNSCPWESDLSF